MEGFLYGKETLCVKLNDEINGRPDLYGVKTRSFKENKNSQTLLTNTNALATDSL